VDAPSSRPFGRSTVTALAFAAVGAFIVILAPEVFFTIVAGVLFSIVLRAPSESISRRFHFPHLMSLVVVTVVLVTATLVGTLVLGSQLAEQLESLFDQLPHSIEAVRHWAQHVPWVQALLRLGIRSAPQDLSPNNVVVGATNVLSSTFQIAVALIAAFFIGLYGAAQPEVYARGLIRLVPPPRRPRAREILEDVNENLSRWLVGRVMAMASVAVITSVGLKLAGIPLPISLGFLAGLFTFIEYLGAVASAVPAILVALSQKPTDALWVILVFTVAHVVEGYLLTPFHHPGDGALSSGLHPRDSGSLRGPVRRRGIDVRHAGGGRRHGAGQEAVHRGFSG
jgi:predicted PurR-regulated permease PerM